MQLRQSFLDTGKIESLKYAIHFYEQTRIKTTYPGAAYDSFAAGISYLSESLGPKFSVLPPKKDERSKLCEEYLVLIETLTSENIVKVLIKLGEDAENIQKQELTRYEINQQISAFTQLAHFIRQTLLRKILRPLSKSTELKTTVESSPAEEKGKNIKNASKKILATRNGLNKILADKLEELYKAQMEPGAKLN